MGELLRIQRKNSEILGLNRVVRTFFSYYLPKIKGSSPQTIRTYKECFKLFLPFSVRFLEKRAGIICIDEISTDLIFSFLDYLEEERKNTSKTRNLRLASIKSMFKMVRMLHPEYTSTAERIINIPQKREVKPLFAFLTHDEVMDVFNAVDLKKKTGFRDYTILHFLYDSGARASEVAGLELENLDTNTISIGILGKGNRYRVVQLWPRTVQLMAQYVQNHRTVPKLMFKRFLFINQRKEKLTRSGIYRICTKYLKKVLPENRVKQLDAVHCFRHSCAVNMLKMGKSISDIKNHLGHEDIKSTMIYLNLDLSRRKEVQKKFIEYTQSFLKSDPKIDDLIDWENKDEIMDWLDTL